MGSPEREGGEATVLMKSVPKIWNPVVLPRNRWTEGGGRSIWRTKAGSVKGMTEVQAGSFVPKNDVEMCRWEEMSTGLMPKRTHTSLHARTPIPKDRPTKAVQIRNA